MKKRTTLLVAIFAAVAILFQPCVHVAAAGVSHQNATVETLSDDVKDDEIDYAAIKQILEKIIEAFKNVLDNLRRFFMIMPEQTSVVEDFNYGGYSVTRVIPAVESLECWYPYFDANNGVFIAEIFNKSGRTLSSESTLHYRSYDMDGMLLNSGTVMLSGNVTSDILPNECCDISIAITDKTTKIEFYSAHLVFASPEIPTIETNLPFSDGGIELKFLSVEDDSCILTVHNSTSQAADGMTVLRYQCYDAEDKLLAESVLFLKNDLAPFTTVNLRFELEAGTSKIIFTSIDPILKDAPIRPGSAPKTNLPYEMNGIKIKSVSFTENKANVTVANYTHKSISALSYIEYTCYDAYGKIIKSGELFLTDMDENEKATLTLQIPSYTRELRFGNAHIFGNG